VITYYSSDVDRVADIVRREFSVDRENSIDKRAVLDPDRFGYLSLYYVVSIYYFCTGLLAESGDENRVTKIVYLP
jgi:putative GTP pyrophosphokinase